MFFCGESLTVRCTSHRLPVTAAQSLPPLGDPLGAAEPEHHGTGPGRPSTMERRQVAEMGSDQCDQMTDDGWQWRWEVTDLVGSTNTLQQSTG